MKTFLKNLFLLPALIAGLGLIPAGRVTAQTFTTVHTNGSQYDLILSGNILYGATGGASESGAGSGRGTVFAVNTDGTGFTNLHSFFNYIDGVFPHAGLILSGNTLYGTVSYGGGLAGGAVFAINTDGSGFTNLHNFYYPTNGERPTAGLILSGNTLYGTTVYGGTADFGTVFAVNTDGTGFTNLHSLTYSDGVYPNGLILSGNTLFGTAAFGGSSGPGTVFALNIDGTDFTTLYSFTARSGAPPSGPYTNSDGALPLAGLILSGNTLYGTTYEGGSSGHGTVFAVNTDGTGFTNLHSFTAGTGSFFNTNSDGSTPQAGLILSGNTLYGTASRGGSSGNGTVFAVNTDGAGFTNLHSFTGGTGGGNPGTRLILSGNTLYGTAGTIFSLSFTPQLTVTLSGANLILTWPTNFVGFDYTGYTLQSTTNLVSPAVWTTVSPGPVVVNGQNAVTNPLSGTQQFFRLSQ